MTKENVLKNKNFILLFLGALVSNTGGIFYSFAVSFHILDITDKNAKIQGIYLAVSGLVFLLTTPIGGVLADRFNKAKIVYMTDFIRGSIILISGYILFLVSNLQSELIVLFITAVFLNIIAAIFTPASASLVRFIVSEEQLRQAQSYFSVLNSFQQIIGIVLAGILVSFIEINLLFAIVGTLYILSGISEIFIRYHYTKETSSLTLRSIFNDYSEGIRYVKSQKAVTTLLFGFLLINFFTNPIFGNATSFFVKTYVKGDYLFKNLLRTPELWASVFSVSLSIGSLVTAIIISSKSDKGNYGAIIKKWIFLFALSLVSVAISFYTCIVIFNALDLFLIIYTILMFVLGITLVCVNISANTAIMQIVEKEKLAKVQSIITIGAMGLTPISSLIGGFVIAGAGLGFLYTVCALGILIAAVYIVSSKAVNHMGKAIQDIEIEQVS